MEWSSYSQKWCCSYSLCVVLNGSLPPPFIAQVGRFWGLYFGSPHATTMEESLGDNTWQWEVVCRVGGVATPWVAHLTASFSWWASRDVWAMPVKFHAIWRSFGLGLGSFSLHDWALIWLGCEPSPLGLFCFVQYGVMLCFLCILNVFSIYSLNALLQMVKHQNLWKLLVLKALCLRLVFILAIFVWKLAVRNVS